MVKYLNGEMCPKSSPDSKVHGTNMGPIWGRQDPGGSHVGPMNFAIWVLGRILHLSYRGLVMPYGDTDLGRYWLR